MISTRSWKLLIVLMAAMVLGTLAFAGAASGKPGNATFTIVAAPDTEYVPIERGFTWTDTLETVDGEPIDGWDGGRCLNLSPDPENLSQWMCEMVFHLPEGDLAMAGAFDFGSGENLVFAVTGGTGVFRNARGEVEVAPVPGENKAFGIFRLLGASVNY